VTTYTAIRQGPRDRLEDAFLTWDGGAVVCDGLGGHNAGDVAASVAVRAFVEAIGGGSSLLVAGGDAAGAVGHAEGEDPSRRGMGTTLVAVRLVGEIAHVLWCGDSRAYLVSPWQSRATLLTADHGFRNILHRWLPAEAHFDEVTPRVRSGDRVVLVTDGVSDVLTDEDIQGAASSAEPARALVELALCRGTADNCTAVVLEAP
jgi:serine/threonine protein phosphatase PrpC